MDFFKSVFSDESDPTKSESLSKSQEQSDPDPNSPPKQQNPNAIDDGGGGGGGWSFGGLFKTITTKSESVIETYRRDLKEFGSGLRKEIEVAQGSLETVGHAIDELGTSVLKGTAQMITHGKDAILTSDQESDSSDNNNNIISNQRSLDSKRYSRFDAQLRAIQGDPSTYCEEAEDLDDYTTWKLGFAAVEKKKEIESLLQENSAMESIYERVVPNSVDEETFWCRYYYRVYKLKQAEDLRANIVKRAILSEEDDLTWDVDDEDDDGDEKGNERNVTGSNANLKANEDLGSSKDLDSAKNITKYEEEETNEINEAGSMSKESDEQIVKSNENKKTDRRDSGQTVGMKVEEVKSIEEAKGEKVLSGGCGDNVASEEVDVENSKDEAISKSDEKSGLEGKGDNGGSSKDSEFSVVLSHPSMPEEDDLGWDEIEDLSSIDEKKASHSGSPNKVDLRKRLSAAEEEEDLSWDIEDDDDEPVKA